jgi:hypothetical protein
VLKPELIAYVCTTSECKLVVPELVVAMQGLKMHVHRKNKNVVPIAIRSRKLSMGLA